MKKILLIAIVCTVFSTCGCTLNIGLGSGEEAHRNIDITPDYTEISTSAAIRVVISDVAQATVSADKEVLPHVLVITRNGRINVRYENGVMLNTHVPTIVTLPLSANLNHVEVSSSARVTCAEWLVLTELSIEASSSAHLDMKIETLKLQAELSSSADCRLSGTVADATIKASSSANFEGYDLTCGAAKAVASSSAAIHLTVTESLEAEASSSGDVYYKGNPSNVRESTSSAGSVKPA